MFECVPAAIAAATASCALSSVKYLFVDPSVRLSVVESATPFSAVMVRPFLSPVIVILDFVAPVRRDAAKALVANSAVSVIPWIFVVSDWWLERFVATVVKNAGSSLTAAASSLSVFSRSGAPSIRSDSAALSEKYVRSAQ